MQISAVTKQQIGSEIELEPSHHPNPRYFLAVLFPNLALTRSDWNILKQIRKEEVAFAVFGVR